MLVVKTLFSGSKFVVFYTSAKTEQNPFLLIIP